MFLRVCRSVNRLAARTLTRLPAPQQPFFWSSKKSSADDSKQTDAGARASNSQKKDSNSDEYDTKSWDNIGHLINNMKQENEKRPKLLPPKAAGDSDKLTVVVEMDEVLVYVFAPDEHEAYMSQPLKDYDYCVHYPDYDTYLSIYKRPGLDSFLAYLRDHTEPILYTQGVKSYTELVLKYIDPEKTFKHVITQEDGCTRIKDDNENLDDFVKDLGLLGRDLKRVVYIDAKPFNFWSNPENGVPIQEYQADSTKVDQEFKNIVNFLEEIKSEEDVRVVCNERFGIREALIDTQMI